jgi:hypothetical protein
VSLACSLFPSQPCRAANPTVTPSDIESSTQKIADEFAAMGIDLKTALKGKVREERETGVLLWRFCKGSGF